MSKQQVKRVRRSYSDEYRRNAVSLIEYQGYTTAQAARELGVNANLLRKWRQKYGKLASANSKVSLTEQQELDRLRKENHRLRMERDLLKKATAFFANEKN
jgi:transposase